MAPEKKEILCLGSRYFSALTILTTSFAQIVDIIEHKTSAQRLILTCEVDDGVETIQETDLKRTRSFGYVLKRWRGEAPRLEVAVGKSSLLYSNWGSLDIGVDN